MTRFNFVNQPSNQYFSYLQDEECLRPGETTDQTFLDKLSDMIGKHPHFVSHSTTDNTTRKTIKRDVSYLMNVY